MDFGRKRIFFYSPLLRPQGKQKRAIFVAVRNDVPFDSFDKQSSTHATLFFFSFSSFLSSSIFSRSFVRPAYSAAVSQGLVGMSISYTARDIVSRHIKTTTHTKQSSSCCCFFLYAPFSLDVSFSPHPLTNVLYMSRHSQPFVIIHFLFVGKRDAFSPFHRGS